MLEKLPHAVGHALQGLGPGLEGTVFYGGDVAAAPATIDVRSDAFLDGAAMPSRYTEDGEGVSPPLAWSGVPPGTAAIVLLVEDADSPTPAPLVHTIAWDLPGADGALPEAGLKSKGAAGDAHALGKNSFLGAAYLPPDPPAGHGPHRYVFQVYALARPLELAGTPGRGALLYAMRGHVLAKGALIGTYERP
jgi:Raf kinase inhibitor-like YbhB/YbcL family protein